MDWATDEEPRNEDPAVISDALTAGVTFIQTYGWAVVVLVLVVLYLRNKLAPQINRISQWREAASEKKIDSSTAQQHHEGMERARARMQEKLDAQSKTFAEKQKELEEKKRQEKIAQYEADRAGRSRPKPAPSTAQPPTPSQGPKKKSTLRPEYNPLMGDTSGGACFRPTRRGGASGGG